MRDEDLRIRALLGRKGQIKLVVIQDGAGGADVEVFDACHASRHTEMSFGAQLYNGSVLPCMGGMDEIKLVVVFVKIRTHCGILKYDAFDLLKSFDIVFDDLKSLRIVIASECNVQVILENVRNDLTFCSSAFIGNHHELEMQEITRF